MSLKRFTRKQLHAIVWEQPMTKLAAEFGLSDVALHKICRKHRVPTPAAGYWQKAHGKRVLTTPLPDPEDEATIIIREGGRFNEPNAVAEARLAALAAAQTLGVSVNAANPIVVRTLTKLSKMREGADGLVRSRTDVRMSVRPETVQRAGNILRQFVAVGEQAGLRLAKGSDGAVWQCAGEIIGFELLEVADQVEHVATEKELAAIAKWQRKRDEDYRRFGYWRDWGEPKIPKWEQRFQGRLAIKLEEVRVQSERSLWGQTVRRTFSDTRTRDVGKVITQAVAAIAAIAAAKKHNREMEARRRAAEQEQARQWADAERRRVKEQKANKLAGELLEEAAAANRLRSLLVVLGGPGSDHPRTAAFVRWAEGCLAAAEAQLTSERIEQRLAEAALFPTEETPLRE